MRAQPGPSRVRLKYSRNEKQGILCHWVGVQQNEKGLHGGCVLESDGVKRARGWSHVAVQTSRRIVGVGNCTFDWGIPNLISKTRQTFVLRLMNGTLDLSVSVGYHNIDRPKIGYWYFQFQIVCLCFETNGK